MKPFFTIVTICRNSKNEIEKTMKSILLQKCTDYQYIIIDGASSDGTLEIIRDMEKRFVEKKRNISVFSEPDQGVYNAMNKGIRKAEGQYIAFINSGDMLFSSDTLSENKTIITETAPGYDIYYGDFYLKSYSMFWMQKGFPEISCLKEHMPSSHQSMFVRTGLAGENPFDESLKIVGDLDFFMRMMLNHRSFYYTDRTVSIVAGEGLSIDYPERTISEKAKIQLKYGFISESESRNILKECQKAQYSANIRRWIKKIVPAWIGKQWRIHQNVWQQSIESDFSAFA